MFGKIFESLFGKKEAAPETRAVEPVVSVGSAGNNGVTAASMGSVVNNDLPVAVAIAACMQYQKDMELAAVITAALAQHLNVPPEGLIVRSIRKTSAWSEQGRLLKVNY